MLGKSFYFLLTGRSPEHLAESNIPPAIFRVIARCCNWDRRARYQSLSGIRESLILAYDVLLHRAGTVLEESFRTLSTELANGNAVASSALAEFVERLASADQEEQDQYVRQLSREFFLALSQAAVADTVREFLRVFGRYVEGRDYDFSYAEVVASRMRFVVDEAALPLDLRAHALELAIRAASYMNRFAAMDACKDIVRAIREPELAQHVAPLIISDEGWFLADLDPSSCRDDTLRSAIRTARTARIASSN